MNPQIGANGGSAARLALGFLAGLLAGKGILTAEQAASFADTIINAYTSIAAVVTLAAGAWAWYQNRQHAKVAIAAANAGVNVAAVKAAPVQAAKPA